MESEKMVELFGIDATAVGEKEYPLGTEVRAFPNGDQLVAKVNDEVVASFSKRYINSLKAESEKRILLGARTGDMVRLSVQVPAMRAILANAHGSISGSNGSYRIEKDKIIYHDDESDDTQVRPIVSASAKIESGEDLKQRVTATRLFFFGVFAFALKKSSGGEKFLTLEGEDFFGREKEIRLANRLLDGKHSLLLSAPRRIGKSSLAKKLIDEKKQQGWKRDYWFDTFVL